MLTYTYQTFYPMANRGFIPGHKAEHEANQLPPSGQEAKNRELYIHLIPLHGMILRHRQFYVAGS
jgi:hypothetical protein